MYGHDCAPLPAALHGGTERQLDQITSLYGNELDSPSQQMRGSAVERSQEPKVPKGARIHPGAVWCVGTPKRSFNLGQAFSKNEM